MPDFNQRENNRNIIAPTHDNIQGQMLKHRNTTKPPNALASVIARSGQKNQNSGNNNAALTASDTEHHADVKKESGSAAVSTERHGYSMQVNEFFHDLRNRSAETAILCVTLREIYQLKDNPRHHRVWVPISLCGKLLELLEKTAIIDADLSSSSQKSLAKEYDPSLLSAVVLVDDEVKKSVEIEKEGTRTRIRSYMTAPTKDKFVEGDVIEMIELYPELMSKLIRFLRDTVIRYMPIIEHKFSSIYSYSGERRFYFDCRSSRWGVRLQVSQVTDRHRNTIGVPLDSLLQFRDQINVVLDKLKVANVDANWEPRQYNTHKTKKNSRQGNVSRRTNLYRNSNGNNRNKKKRQENQDLENNGEIKIELDNKPAVDLQSIPVVLVN